MQHFPTQPSGESGMSCNQIRVSTLVALWWRMTDYKLPKCCVLHFLFFFLSIHNIPGSFTLVRCRNITKNKDPFTSHDPNDGSLFLPPVSEPTDAWGKDKLKEKVKVPFFVLRPKIGSRTETLKQKESARLSSFVSRHELICKQFGWILIQQ